MRSRLIRLLGMAAVLSGAVFVVAVAPPAEQALAQEPGKEYTAVVRPMLQKYCLACHAAKVKKGGLDLERFATLGDIRKDLKPWQMMVELLEAREMPPKEKPQPSAAERKQLIEWVRGVLDAEARARAGDPGHVPLRRLSNAEYDATVRDLTGVDLRPAREFPADGAAGEGFTNAAESLGEISPALFTKYLNAAKEIADHTVLLPDGFRFSPSKTRRDWTDEGTAALRQFYAAYASGDGKLPVQPYLLATVRHRPALARSEFDAVAAREKLHAKYLRAFWNTLNDRSTSQPLNELRVKWRTANEKDVPALAADIAGWQAALWRTVKIGNYIQAGWNSADSYVESLTRQVPVNPPVAESVPLRLAVKPAPGQADVTVYLAAREDGAGGPISWRRPRFEGPSKPPLLLADYAKYGAAYEIDFAKAFANTAKYLAAAVELANEKELTVETAAQRHGLDAGFLKRWSEVLAVAPYTRDPQALGRVVPAVELTLLEEATTPNPARPAINGWRRKGTDLPVLVTNASDKVEQIPGRIPAKGVGMHPMPREFVAVVWTAPVAAELKISSKIVHAHPACGNGVAWWLEHRRGGRALVLDEGPIDLGGEARPEARTLKVEAGDRIILAIDAKNNDHSCDMTAIELRLTETGGNKRVWDLAADVVANVLDGNPHADRQGHKGVWSFVRGPSRPLGKSISNVIPQASALGRWREAAADPKRKDEAAKLARQVQSLLAGPRPTVDKTPERTLYDNLVVADGPLLAGVDVSRFARRMGADYGLAKARFSGAELVAKSGEPVAVKLPAALFAGREFVVDAVLGGDAGGRLARVRVAASPPGPQARWDGPLIGSPDGAAYKKLVAGYDEFRRIFPLYVCFPIVVPTDEVVTLKMFHREDEPLERLFLDDAAKKQLDRLWAQQRFISRQPVAEYAYLPQFMGFTTQDTPKAFQQFFIDRKPLFKTHADEFLAEERAAIPRQLDALLDFASRAFRRPLAATERAELRKLYEDVRAKGAAHEEAFRGVLERVLVAPAFLFRIEQAPPGKEPGPVNDWELATRLSYFLWSSMPDSELRHLAAEGRLRDPQVLAAQARRMLNDPRVRSLAIEFGTQWLHVRGFDELKEKNEQLFPTFDAELRRAIYEESILFFQDLFQADRPVTNVLDADYTFVNELLAKHYGIPSVSGPQWRRVEGVKKYGRGGILGMASVQAKQSGASRTSPVLRGNWVVETLLGEKLPRPPANVPRLPEDEKNNDGLSVRQLVEKHAKVPECAVCHVRIDPFGFALERYDPIGRWREKDLGGLPVDTRAKLKDGTEFDGLDGLRDYLLTKKKDIIVRLFCRKLLGYALGRAVTLSDQALVEEMMAELNKSGGRVTGAILGIIRSPQFRMIRGQDTIQDE